MPGKFKTFDTSTSTVCLGHPPNEDTSHKIAPNATVTLNGSPSKTTDLRPDDNIVLSGDPATSVTATR